MPLVFYVSDFIMSWSGGDIKILDGNGGLAYTVDAKAWSTKQLRVVKDGYGNPVCSMKQKVRLVPLIAVYLKCLCHDTSAFLPNFTGRKVGVILRCNCKLLACQRAHGCSQHKSHLPAKQIRTLQARCFQNPCSQGLHSLFEHLYTRAHTLLA